MDNNLLNDRIGMLKEWKQTESLNEILYNTLSSLHTYAKDRFDNLTGEIRNEYTLNNKAPVIKVAVCTEENVDKYIFLRPVATQPPLNSPNYITTVFAHCDYLTMQRLMRQTYTAKIQGKAGTFQTQVELKYSSKYLQKMESLYYAFSENELPWATINGRYFYKFLDVCSKQQINQEIDGFEIDFAPYEKYVSYDKVLLWNISTIAAPVAACEAKPAYNAIQYEHLLKNIPIDEDQYLVCSLGEKFSSFRRGKEIYVRTYKKKFEQIELLRIISNEDSECPLFLPVKSNQKKPGFVNAMAGKNYIPTWGEAERIISSLGETADLRLVDIQVPPCTDDNMARYKGVDYNSFREENMVLKDRKPLLFTFDIRADKLWAHEIMYYILSELQLHFYEYRCVGKLL